MRSELPRWIREDPAITDPYEQCESGYWLGGITLHGISCRVELIEVKYGIVEAINLLYQDRIDCWLHANEYESPKWLIDDKRQWFLHVEVYAQ